MGVESKQSNARTDFARRLLKLSQTGANQRVHTALDKVQGLVMDTPFSGPLRFGNRKALLRMETEENIHVAWRPRSPVTAEVCLLSVNHTLAGNARIAMGSKGILVLADTQVNGQAHLPATMAHIQASMRRAADATSGKQPSAPPEVTETPAVTSDQIEKLLGQLGWEQDAVVPLQGTWDLRPRLRNDAISVSMAPFVSGVRLARVVLTNVPKNRCDRRTAVVDHAVRTNARLRGARLAMCDGNIVAETLLHADQLQGKWLSDAAYAVATAAQLARLGLRILIDQPTVAQVYVETLRPG